MGGNPWAPGRRVSYVAAEAVCEKEPKKTHNLENWKPLWPSPEAAREGIKSIWEEANFSKVCFLFEDLLHLLVLYALLVTYINGLLITHVSVVEVAFLAHGDANDENNVLSLWYDGLKQFAIIDGKTVADTLLRVNGFAVKTVNTTGAGDAFVGDFFLPYQRMKLIPHTDMGIEHLKHALEISPGNEAAYFGLASRLLGLSKECVNNGAFSWGASLLKEASDVANASTVLTGKCFLHLETSFNSLMPKLSQLRESVKSKRLQLINFNKTTTTSTIIQSQMPHLDEWSALEVDYSTSLSGAITALQAASLRLPVNENVRVDIKELEGALNSASNVIETMSSHFQSFLPKKLPFTLVNPARGSGRDLDELQTEINVSCKRINKEFGYTGYEPIVYIDKPLSISERIAFYSISECVVVSAVRDGMNLTPYEYIVCRQGISGLGSGSDSSGIKKSMLVVSEFVGCSASLSGAIRINLWNIETIGEALYEAISMEKSEKQLIHEKYYRWIQMAEDVMKLYIEATDDSSIETKESGLVWHHQDANPGFGSCQTKEMLDHLESVLANEVVAMKRGQFIIEVKPQGVSKGIVADKVFTSIANDERKDDFALCIGDDRLDEEMFEIIKIVMSRIASP
ncbi:hypothetical protein GIB67_017663 [Kingdonia uniflora]|uniref:Uncharacterized protein n=1 Tax=Kingdonia uniflora TaxID=39325 RepID=A0A7J7N9Y7_9MAGN|nr:hypothetical protein GIB67_017663 [Kingdonia uniflora]